MSRFYNGLQEAATPAPAASAANHARGTIQRKPIASSSAQSEAAPSGSAMPQHSLSVSSAGQDVYTVSPASSIHRDRDGHSTEHQEVLSPVSQGQQSSPGMAPPAAVASYPEQWQQIEGATGHPHERSQQVIIQEFSGAGVGPGQPELLPPFQRQSFTQWSDLTRSSWIFPRAGSMSQTSGEHSTIPQPGSQRRPSDLQLELAEARARETLSGRGPRIVSYGPAPPAEDHGLAPTSFTVPVSYPPVDQSHEISTTPWQAVEPGAAGSNWVLDNSQNTAHLAPDVTVNFGSSGNGGEMTNEKTKLDMAQQRKRSPFMHYEDIDYFGPEAEETDVDSPDLEVEQEKLKLAEAQLELGGAERAISRGKGKLHLPKTAVTEVNSAIIPTPVMSSTSSPPVIKVNNGSTMGYSHPSVSGTTTADVLQMGVKARRSWERQQRRQLKKQQQHLDQPSSHMSTLGAARQINMIMRIPSLISSAGRGGGSSVGGGGSNDNSSRNGDGRLNSNNPYYTHDQSINGPHRNDDVGSSHSNRNRSFNGHQDVNIPTHKAIDIDSVPPNEGVILPWMPEILWSLISLATVIAIFLTLRAFDGKSIDPKDWPISPNVTLNTLIAFLTAICQLALLVPITQGLAQLKWSWFTRAAPGGIPRQGRPLEDFALFDDAAFGTGKWGGWPLAALKLLSSGKGRTLGVSACVVLLTGFLSSPFTQGAVGYQTMLVPVVGNDSVASVVRSEAYFLSSSGGQRIARGERSRGATNPYQDLRASQKRAIQHGIHYYTHSTSANYDSLPAIPLLPHIAPQCSTPSCQFPLFSSLAVCVDIADVSSRLSVSKLSTTSGRTPLAAAYSVLGFMPDSGTTSLRNASLPNGAYLLGSTGTCNLNISSPASAVPSTSSGDRRRAGNLDILTGNETLAFANQPDKLSAAIANFFFFYTNQTTTSPESPSQDAEATFSAVEVLVHFCVNTYNVSVTQGVPATEVVNSSTSVAQITTSEEGTRILNLQDPLSSGSSSSNNSEPYLSVNLTATWALQDQLVSLIRGSYSSWYGDLMQGLTPASEVLGAAMFDSDFMLLSSSALAADNDGTINSRGGEEPRLQKQETIGNWMLNVATSLTNTIRASSSSTSTQSSTVPRQRRQTKSSPSPTTAEDGSRTIISGTAFLPKTAIKIHYPLMTFLSIQVFLSMAFLVGIIIQTFVWGVPVLKGSSMAALLATIGPIKEDTRRQDEEVTVGTTGAVITRRSRRGVRLRPVASSMSSTAALEEAGRWGRGWYLDITGSGSPSAMCAHDTCVHPTTRADDAGVVDCGNCASR